MTEQAEQTRVFGPCNASGSLVQGVGEIAAAIAETASAIRDHAAAMDRVADELQGLRDA